MVFKMDVLKFKLSGKTAFFKKPDVNSYIYFTYTHIHKIAVLGIFGSILGYGGHNQYKDKLKNDKNCKDKYPEFYDKLKDIKISVEPLNEKGTIPKKIQIFNNSVGYASLEQGGNLIVKEQWLENPSWNIYLLLDNDEALKICEYITNKKSVFTQYLGKNDHIADISEVEIIKNTKQISNVDKIDSLFVENNACIDFDEENEDDEDIMFKYKESLPIYLCEETNLYKFEKFIYTNAYIEEIKSDFIYKVNEKNIMFF